MLQTPCTFMFFYSLFNVLIDEFVIKTLRRKVVKFCFHSVVVLFFYFNIQLKLR